MRRDDVMRRFPKITNAISINSCIQPEQVRNLYLSGEPVKLSEELAQSKYVRNLSIDQLKVLEIFIIQLLIEITR